MNNPPFTFRFLFQPDLYTSSATNEGELRYLGKLERDPAAPCVTIDKDTRLAEVQETVRSAARDRKQVIVVARTKSEALHFLQRCLPRNGSDFYDRRRRQQLPGSASKPWSYPGA